MTAKKPPAKKKRHPGRPSVLTEEVKQLYLEARLKGGNDTDCAAYAGITHATIINWRNRLEIADPKTNDKGELAEYADDEANPPIPELFAFFTAIKATEAAAKLDRLSRIEIAARDPKYWTAAAWWLERKFPDEYGRRERRDVTMHISLQEAEARIDAEIEALEATIVEEGT